MSLEVGKQALDFLVANSGSRKNLEVDFFGGEPLLNFGVVKQLVAYARSIEDGEREELPLHPHDERYAYRRRRHRLLQQGDEQRRSQSLTGSKEIHDRFSVWIMPDSGSWDTIVPKFRKLVDARGGKNYYMRGTFTHANPDFTKRHQSHGLISDSRS